MAARVSFRQDDIARAIKGAQCAGIKVARIEISPVDGTIVIVAETGKATCYNESNPRDSEFEEI